MTASSRFDTDTAVERLGPGHYSGHIDRGWWIIAGPNGGYVAAILLRALMAEVDDAKRAPRSLTVHYLRPPAEGPVEIHVTVERAGRTVSTLSARMVQEGRLLCIALAAFGLPRPSFSFADRSPPVLPSPDLCVKLRERHPASVELQHRYDSRIGLGADFFSGADRAIIGGWIRLEEPRIVDAPLVAAFSDALPPAVFARATERSGLGPVPTIDLTVHFRADLPLAGAAPTDFCAVVFTTTVARDGFLEEDGEVWSADGVLLAQSRQLALVS